MPAISDTAPELRSFAIRVVLSYWPLALVVLSALLLSRKYFHGGLHRYPGPLLANFTDAWRMWDVKKNKHHYTLQRLHAKYGPVVRTGPNTVDISDVEYIPQIYGIRKGFTKTAFYNGFGGSTDGRKVENTFSTRNENLHTEMKRQVSGMYALSALQEYEPLVDDMIRLFMDRAEAEFDGPSTKGRACDMAAWLQYYAFDVILNLTFGNTLGFMAQGADAGNFIEGLEQNLDRLSLCTQMPWLTRIFLSRLLPLDQLQRSNGMFLGFVRQQIAEHAAKLEGKQQAEKAGRPDDMLTRFMSIPDIKPERVMIHATANVLAGSDTTSITLRAILYHLLRHPHCMAKVMAELRATDPPLSYPVTWKESQQLPYLRAVVEESLRIFPAVGLSLEREVPAAGLAMPNGHVLPAGTFVGVNAWVAHRQTSTFGPLPVDEFRPERWLRADKENEEAFQDRLVRMKGASLAFGWGKRICLGRNISYLEVFKFIPTLLLEFDIGLVEPEREWTSVNRWFVRQSGMDCWLRRRVNRT